MKSLRLPALAAALVLAACSAPAPTESSALAAEANLEQGPGMMGSGNSPQDAGTGGYTGESTVSNDSIGRGGNTLGSGN